MLAAFCEIPEEVIGHTPVLVIRGQHELEVCGCTGIREYGKERIVLAFGKEQLAVSGEMLELTDFRENTLYVRGKIHSVTYETEEGKLC